MMIQITLKVLVIVLYVEENFALDLDNEDATQRRTLCGVPKIEPSDIQERIIGGTSAVPGSWPWQVLLLYSNEDSSKFKLCGGSIISKRYILTAAQCFTNATEKNLWTVHVGGHENEASSQEFLVKNIHYYPGTIAMNKIFPPNELYPLKNSHHDLALIKLKRSLKYSDKVMPVCLPMADDVVDSKTLCVATGYGQIDAKMPIFPPALKQVTAPIIQGKECEELTYGSAVADTMICAGHKYGGKDICYGDTGGPLVCYKHNEWTLYGVASFGLEPCGRYGAASIYTYVPKYVGWINDLLWSKLSRV